MLDGHSIGQPGMQRACLFCATSRALSSENRNVEVRKFSLSGDFSPEYNLDNLSRTCSPLQNTNTALTNFTGPRVFSVDPTNDPLLPHSSRSSQSANQLTPNLPALPGGEGCKRMVEWDRPQAPQWHLFSRLESTASTAVNAMSVHTWHPVRQEQRADITKLFPNQEEGDTNRMPCGSRHRPNSDSLSGGPRRLSQKQLQSEQQQQQPAVRPSPSISLQTFLTLWLKMSGCSSATDLDTSALTNPGACVVDQRTLPSPTSGNFLSRLSNFFKPSEASQSSESTVVPSKQEMGSARCSTLLPLRLVNVGSARCAFGSDIVTWLLENSDGALSCR
ncbi:unnamed protein product [Dibothriocephalus latus]|uniref:Uncharacterized protein n=1 Tax=Dibothriocephalus latus TaxID=60516 RepID=A0A3P7QI24_DIBLA|nr:unnamed protein product [Dibothriocephalus latus]